MGWCHEFGSQITEGCDHPMRAEPDHCGCSVCGVACPGRFSGCGAVWALGPRPDAAGRPQLPVAPPTKALAAASVPAASTTVEVVPLRASAGAGPDLLALEVAFTEMRAGLDALEREARRQRRAINALAESASPDRLAGLEREVRRQREVIKALAEKASFERLASLAKALPERIAAASAAAVVSRIGGDGVPDLALMADDLHDSITAVQDAATQMRREMAELVHLRHALVAGTGPAPGPVANGTAGPAAPAVPVPSEPAQPTVAPSPIVAHPGRSLGDKVTALGARPEWRAVREKLTGRRDEESPLG